MLRMNGKIYHPVPVRLTVSSSVGFNNNINNSIKKLKHIQSFFRKLNITIDLEKNH